MFQTSEDNNLKAKAGDIIRINYKVSIADYSKANDEILGEPPELSYTNYSIRLESII